MSNFKLTDENKQTLIMALTFSDNKLVEQSRDTLIQRIKDGKVNDAYDLIVGCVIFQIALKDYCKVLKRQIADGKIDSENVDSERKQFRFCCHALEVLESNITQSIP